MHGPHFIITAAACFLGVSTILITLHEFGHYLTARAFGLKAKAFSLGFGPELAGFTDSNGTRWKICPIPLGGYCSFHGEMHPGAGKGDDGDHPQSFAKLARWKRACVIFAGPLVNAIICGVVLGGLFMVYGEPRVSNVIEGVMPGTPAAVSGIQPGDRLMSWNGIVPDGDQSLIRHIKLHPGAPLDLVIDHNGTREDKKVVIKPREMVDRWGNHAQVGLLGVEFGTMMRPTHNPFMAVGAAVRETFAMFEIQIETMGQLVRGERSLDEVSGPIRLAKFAGEQYLSGWTALIYFAGILSMAIAFTNLLPIPGLDGGYLTLYAVETAIRRDLPKKVFMGAIKVGYACILVLMTFAFSNDFRVLLWH